MGHFPLPFEYFSVEDATHAVEERGRMLSMEDTCGFFLCQHGSINVSLDDKTFHIQQGDVYFYTPSMFVCLLDYSNDLEGIAVKCDIEFVLPMLEQTVRGGNVLAIREKPCISLRPEQQRNLEDLANLAHEHYQHLIEESRHFSSASEVLQHLVMSLAKSLFYELIYDYAQNQSLMPQVHDAKDRIFQTFLVSLFSNYKREREVSFYAAEQCLSSRYFSSVIKEKSGHSALQWIIQMVISSARQQLKSTDSSIKEIASDFNFPSQSFFGKYFKQYVGMSPKEYRHQERNNR
ncbi:MAG: AraC family transcriptional regulator [Bacteroidales bacterium]|nr:AraC family transcriptional regulator [Bacteroidales bacterium]